MLKQLQIYVQALTVCLSKDNISLALNKNRLDYIRISELIGLYLKNGP